MKYYVGLDVSLAETSLCVVDADGRVARETKVAIDAESLVAELRRLEAAHGFAYERIGIEACMLAQHLFGAMVEACPPCASRPGTCTPCSPPSSSTRPTGTTRAGSPG